MTEHERLLEEFDDAYFALLMEGVARKEGEQLEALNEMLQDNPEAVVPERVDKRCLETIDRHFAREHRRAGLRRTGKVLRLAAIIMGISVLLFTSAFALSEDFRVATLNLMLTITEKYTQFDIENSDGNSRQVPPSSSTAGFEYFENAKIGWIPEGFKYTSGEYDRYAWFENDSDDFFYIFLHPGSGTLRIDTENVDSLENISINGNEGICVVKNGAIEIVITDLANYLLIEVSASIDASVDTAKKIAENIFIS